MSTGYLDYMEILAQVEMDYLRWIILQFSDILGSGDLVFEISVGDEWNLVDIGLLFGLFARDLN